MNVYDVSLLVIEGDELLQTFVDAPPGENKSVNHDEEVAALVAWANKVREYLTNDSAERSYLYLFSQADIRAKPRWLRDADPHFTYTRHTLTNRLTGLRLFVLRALMDEAEAES